MAEATSAINYLPRSLRELAKVIGLPAALRLVEHYGGISVYVPTPERLGSDHHLTTNIGPRAARALAAYMQGGDLEVPLCRATRHALAHRDIVERSAAGDSERTIARLYGISGRAVRYHRARARAEGQIEQRQGGLFD